MHMQPSMLLHSKNFLKKTLILDFIEQITLFFEDLSPTVTHHEMCLLFDYDKVLSINDTYLSST